PLSTRCKSALKKIDIEKVSDVVAKTGQELLDYGLKQIYLDELEVNIKEQGFEFRSEEG
ncbi:MAG: hypothetical protein GY941_06860, partial [Planctomycetes bacterium]|nr:hypothetical protein [Planctomycetota bacterium]